MRTSLQMRLPADPLTLIVPVALFIVTFAIVILARRVLFSVLRRWADSTDSHVAQLATETLSGPIILWAIILALNVATQAIDITPRYARYLSRAIEVLWVWSFTVALSRFAGRAIRYYGTPAKGVKSVTSLTQKLVQFAVVAFGIVWMLKAVFDISLGPVLTTLGVGGLAVALALQDTLSNLFAGFYVSISGLINLGDYIKLSSGEEGFISDITWRCTTMRTGSNNLIVIPNKKLAESIYTNFQMPESRMGASFNLNLAIDTDVERAAAILAEEVVSAPSHISGLLSDPAPGFRLNDIGETGLVFLVYFNVPRFSDQFQIAADLRTRLFLRLRREGVQFHVSQAPPRPANR